jgi:hypothetical protein
MSLISRVNAARDAVTALSSEGPGFFNRRQKHAVETIDHFVHRALALPEGANMPDSERSALRDAVGTLIETLERYLDRPGRAADHAKDERPLAEAIYKLREADERIATRPRPI